MFNIMHGFLSQDTWLSLGLTVAMILVFGSGYLAVSDKYQSVEATSQNTTGRQHQKITGLSFRQYNRHGVVTRLEADTLTVMPRRFLVFNIKSINEAHFTNVRADTYVYPDESQDATLLLAAAEILPSDGRGNSNKQVSELGLITKCTVEGVYLKIFKTRSLAIVLRAGFAEIDMKSGKTQFNNVILENPSATRRITGKKIIWDAKDQEFSVPGDYIAYTDNGRASGKGIKVDLDFQISSL